jgi:hypothetical protein
MADLIFITPKEMTETTVIGGNVDTDKYTMCILNTQVRIIEPLLGSELYDKISIDLENDTLTGDYLTLFNEYVKPITKYESCADYIAISPYSLTNGGLYKNNPENVEIVNKKEVDYLSERYSSIAQTFVTRFDKWIGLNFENIPEYKTNQNEVNAQNINVNNGWHF